jgi:hypothetical protein
LRDDTRTAIIIPGIVLGMRGRYLHGFFPRRLNPDSRNLDYTWIAHIGDFNHCFLVGESQKSVSEGSESSDFSGAECFMCYI